MNETLLDRTRRLLAERDQPFREIAAAVDVSESWLAKFSRASYRHSPRLDTVQRLHDYLVADAGARAIAPHSANHAA